MPVTVTDEVLHSARMTEAEMRTEIAVALFQQERMTLGQAAIFAGLSQVAMQRVLAGRRIPLHYGVEEMEADLAMVQSQLRG